MKVIHINNIDSTERFVNSTVLALGFFDYIIDLNVTHVVAGFDYTYGHKGTGTMDTMINHGCGKFEVTVLPKVELNGIKISSTHIRNLLFRGDVKQVKSFMGSDYEAKGQLYTPNFGKIFQTSSLQNFVPNRNAYAFVPGNHCLIPCVGKYTVEIQSITHTESATAEVFVGMNNGKEIIINFYNHSKLSYNDIELRIKWLELIEIEGIRKNSS